MHPSHNRHSTVGSIVTGFEHCGQLEIVPLSSGGSSSSSSSSPPPPSTSVSPSLVALSGVLVKSVRHSWGLHTLLGEDDPDTKLVSGIHVELGVTGDGEPVGHTGVLTDGVMELAGCFAGVTGEFPVRIDIPHEGRCVGIDPWRLEAGAGSVPLHLCILMFLYTFPHPGH